jgi:hypothetical protein
MTRADDLTTVREVILRIIRMNPHNYQSLTSYQRALRREKALVRAEIDAAGQRS